MKKYLKTIEDIEALRNTDTTLRIEGSTSWYRFVNGTLCRYCLNGDIFYNVDLPYFEVYIEVDEHDCVRQDAEDEPSEDWIGKLGWFCDYDKADDGFIDVLKEVEDGEYFPEYGDASYLHFRPLTPEEVEKYTGYKVVEDV